MVRRRRWRCLTSNINSAQARAANIPIPYPSFPSQRLRTVAQALRPYPQYQNIVTGVQNGDKSGHSSYHAMVLKVDRRYSAGLTFNWNYTLLEAPDRFRFLLRQRRHGDGSLQPRSGEVHRPFRPDARSEVQHAV